MEFSVEAHPKNALAFAVRLSVDESSSNTPEFRHKVDASPVPAGGRWRCCAVADLPSGACHPGARTSRGAPPGRQCGPRTAAVYEYVITSTTYYLTKRHNLKSY